MGHLGNDRTTELIKSRFYWPLMDVKIKHFVTEICPYTDMSLRPKKNAPHNEISSNGENINIRTL